MSSLIISLIIITIPLWACAIYIRLVLQDDLGYYFEGWQPKVALVVFPEVFTTFTGLDKIGAEEGTIHTFDRGLGWLFLGGVFVLMWLL